MLFSLILTGWKKGSIYMEEKKWSMELLEVLRNGDVWSNTFKCLITDITPFKNWLKRYQYGNDRVKLAHFSSSSYDTIYTKLFLFSDTISSDRLKDQSPRT